MASTTGHRLLILSAAILFSTGGAAIKATALSSWQVASFRSGVAALALYLALPAWRRLWRPRTLAVGAAYAATMILYVGANKLTTAANTIFLQSTAPMYLLLLGPWLLKERVKAPDLFITAALAGGMAMFFVGIDPPRVTAPSPLAGNVLGAAAGLTWALTILGMRWLGKEENAAAAGAGVIVGNLVACLVCLPFALPAQPVIADWAIILYLGVFQIGLAYVCMSRGVGRVPALETSLLLLMEPVLNAVWAWWIHGERPGAWSLGGCAVILAATLGRALAGGRRGS